MELTFFLPTLFSYYHYHYYTALTITPLPSPPLVLLLTYSIHSSSLWGGKRVISVVISFLFFLRVGGLTDLAGRLMAASCAFLWAFFFPFHALSSFFGRTIC